MSYSAETGLSRLPKNITELPPTLPPETAKGKPDAINLNVRDLEETGITDDGHLNLELLKPTDGAGELASVDITGGPILVGVGAVSGLANWNVIGADLPGIVNVFKKLGTGQNLDNSDKLVLGGYFELTGKHGDDKITKLIAAVLNSQKGNDGKPVNFEVAVSAQIKLEGIPGTKKMRLESITIAPLAVIPQIGTSKSGYENFSAPEAVLTLKRDGEGGWEIDTKTHFNQGTFGIISAPNLDDDPQVINAPNIKALVYGMATMPADRHEGLGLAARQLLTMADRATDSDWLGKKGQNPYKIADVLNAVRFLGHVGEALFGDGPTDGKEPLKGSFHGWIRTVIGTPTSVPGIVVGPYIQGNLKVDFVNDGDNVVRFFTTGNSEPFLEISVVELKQYYENTKDVVIGAINKAMEHPVIKGLVIDAQEYINRLEQQEPAGWERPEPGTEILNPPGSTDKYGEHQLGGGLEPQKEPPKEPPADLLSPKPPDGSRIPDEYEENQLGGGTSQRDLPPRPLEENQEIY